VQARAVAVPAPKAAPRPAPVPSNLHGFEVLRTDYISEYDASAVLYRHKKTGAEVCGCFAIRGQREP